MIHIVCSGYFFYLLEKAFVAKPIKHLLIISVDYRTTPSACLVPGDLLHQLSLPAKTENKE